jgi:RES domain-containing protein
LTKYRIFPVKFTTDLVKHLNPLPKKWDHDPILPHSMEIGDTWVKKDSSPVLKVPSVIVPWEYNYILNPSHPDFKKIEIGTIRSFALDRRLIH